jgi:hypothetical protein
MIMKLILDYQAAHVSSPYHAALDMDTTVLSSEDEKQHQPSAFSSVQQGVILFLHR